VPILVDPKPGQCRPGRAGELRADEAMSGRGASVVPHAAAQPVR
jgi:hypothetical protein